MCAGFKTLKQRPRKGKPLELSHMMCCSPFLCLGDGPASTDIFNPRKLPALKALRSCVLRTGGHHGIKKNLISGQLFMKSNLFHLRNDKSALGSLISVHHVLVGSWSQRPNLILLLLGSGFGVPRSERTYYCLHGPQH